jgi:Family of unknown function (DUF5670)
MKKIKVHSIAAICLITVILLSSCSIMRKNDFSAQKYTNFKKGKSTVNINPVNKEKKDADLYSVISDKKEVSNDAIVDSKKPSQSIKTSKPEINNESVKTEKHVSIFQKEKIKRTTSFVMNRLTNKANTTSYRDNGNGLSLFWVVILIILILWAIGLAAGGFGLGGLINVLLVIALILLILWLLQIV